MAEDYRKRLIRAMSSYGKIEEKKEIFLSMRHNGGYFAVIVMWACMHDGADGGGAPRSNHNALRHGRYTAQAIARRREVAAPLHACRDQLGAMCDV
jgi:hypothetical protein